MAKTTLYSAKSWLAKNSNVRNLLKSRAVLYFFFVISLVNLFSFATTHGNEAYAAIFLLVGYLTTFFSKNMIVIMCIGLVTANVLKYGTEVRVIDGFTDGNSPDSVGNTDIDEKEPVKVVPVKAEPVKAEPVKAEIVKAEPVKSEPVKAETVKADTIEKPIYSTSEKDLTAIKGDLHKTMKSMDEKVIDPEQKKNIKGLLDLQIKILDGVTGLTPLLNEAKMAVEKIKSGNAGIM